MKIESRKSIEDILTTQMTVRLPRLRSLGTVPPTFFFPQLVENYLHPQFGYAKFAGHGGCMRIQEMRSGRAYLSKRMPADQVTSLELRELREVFNDEPLPIAEVRPEPRSRAHIPLSELEKNQWTVVSFDGVEAGGMTYDQASRLIKVLGENGINGLCIITDVAALQID